MQFSIIILAICFFLFLYILHVVSKDDFVIVRKGIQVEQIFNIAFITTAVSLFFARFFYVIFNSDPILRTVLGFIVFPYFPGLYLAGAIIGGPFFLAFYSYYKKLPVGKIFDLFSISLSAALPFGIFGNQLLAGKNSLLYSLILFFVYMLLSIIFFKVVFPYTQRNNLKEGSLGILFLISLSIIGFITNLIQFWGKYGIFEKDSLLWALVFIICIIIVVKRELVEKSITRK